MELVLGKKFFRQILKRLEDFYKDTAGLHMCYEDFRGLCREAWEKIFLSSRSQILKERKVSFSICNGRNTEMYSEGNTETKPFQKSFFVFVSI